MRNIARRTKALRTSLGLSQKELAKKIGVAQSSITRIEAGTTKSVSHDIIAALAKLAGLTVEQYAGIPVPGEPDAPRAMVRVVGELAAGEWKEALESPAYDQYEVPAPSVRVLEDMPMEAFIVRGESMNRIYPDGSIVYVVRLSVLGRAPFPGEKVVVVRTDADGTVEGSLKVYRTDDKGKPWLWPDSDDPRYQAPLQMVSAKKKTESVVIHGIVVSGEVSELDRMGIQ